MKFLGSRQAFRVYQFTYTQGFYYLRVETKTNQLLLFTLQLFIYEIIFICLRTCTKLWRSAFSCIYSFPYFTFSTFLISCLATSFLSFFLAFLINILVFPYQLCFFSFFSFLVPHFLPSPSPTTHHHPSYIHSHTHTHSRMHTCIIMWARVSQPEVCP